MEKKLFIPLAALAVLGMTNIASAARRDGRERDKNYNDVCAPEPGAPCYPDDAPCAMCLGPDNTAVNPAVRPYTCNGDIFVTVAGFYWNAHQDGMEYAIDNAVAVGSLATIIDPALTLALGSVNNLIDAKYKDPDFHWEFGFKLGVGYNSACDGWDIGVLWTWYRGRAHTHIETETDDNHILIPLWSAFAPAIGGTTLATDIETSWKLQLNLIDIELGREMWVSRYVTFRPHMGLRIAFIEQDWNLEHRGGSFSGRLVAPLQPAFNNFVDIDNDFKGVGVRGGFDTVWNFGRGWGLYGNFAGSIVYGRFHIEHDENNKLATAPTAKVDLIDTQDHFRASRGILDLAIGVQYSAMFCQCKYRFTAMLGWEHHLFFNQNQMWRITRVGDIETPIVLPVLNLGGENVYSQRRGDLSLQGWTLTLRFEF